MNIGVVVNERRREGRGRGHRMHDLSRACARDLSRAREAPPLIRMG
jgi:hypothetical protein